MNMLPRLSNPFEHVCVRNIFKNSLATICQIWSHRSLDFAFDSEIHCMVIPSGSCKSKNFARYLKKTNVSKYFLIFLYEISRTCQQFPFHHLATYTIMNNRSSQCTGHYCTCRRALGRGILLALTFFAIFFLPWTSNSKLFLLKSK